VQRWNSDTSTWGDLATTGAAVGASIGGDPEYTDSSVTRGNTYYYRVAAVNSQGTGPYFSPYRNADIPEGTPDAPTLMATATGPYTVQLSWNIPEDNGTEITGFLIAKWVDATDDDTTNPTWVDISDGTTVVTTATDANATATQTFYIDDSLMPNIRYDYQISAVTAGTNSRFAQANAKTHIGAPGRPQNVTATADGTDAIKLEWTAPSNHGSPIDRYEVWTWDTAAKSWGWNGVAGAVHTVSHPVTTFTHSGLDAGTQNIYRVRAVNDATNDNGGVGDWSTIVSARTDDE
jgi:hypothetical protein